MNQDIELIVHVILILLTDYYNKYTIMAHVVANVRT